MKTLIFDFDGTIADTLKWARRIADEILPQVNHPGLNDEDIEKIRHMTIPQGLKYAKIPVYRLPQLAVTARNYMKEHIEDLEPVEGIIEVITHLKDKDVPLAMVTSNTKENVYSFLKREGLEDAFNFINAGVSTFGKSRLLKQTLKKHDLDLEDTIYIGDELRDIAAAKTVGMKIVAVGWGLNHPDVLKEQQPDAFVSKPRDLLKLLEEAL